MARTPLELPTQFPFSTELPIYMSHINQGQHLDNVQMLTLVMETRQRFFAWLGFPNAVDIGGLMLAAGEMLVQYKAEAFYGETMRVRMAVGELGRCSVDLPYVMEDVASGRLICQGKVSMVFMDLASRRAAPVPPVFRERVAQL
ncbi:MAG TPA: thioesterase family protein [Macromonas sp.]|nr:thioesterase family protein [Macromonas sp.]